MARFVLTDDQNARRDAINEDPSLWTTDRCWRSRPPLDHPSPEAGIVWVLHYDLFGAEDDSDAPGSFIVGVYASRRDAFRGLIRNLIEWDGRPLDRLHRLTWEVNPHGHVIEAWNDDRWLEDGEPVFRFEQHLIESRDER